MNELDQIILHQLKDFGCTFENEGKVLCDFDLKDIVNAIIFCINLIEKDVLKNYKFDYDLNMAKKYQIASNIAQFFQKINYKADIGYQTFLYFNDKEFRKLFLFLFEKLSEKELKNQIVSNENSLESILKKIKISFEQEDNNKKKPCLFWNVNNLFLEINFDLNKKVNEKNDFLANYWVLYHDVSTLLEWNSLNLNNNYKFIKKLNQNLKVDFFEKDMPDIEFKTNKINFFLNLSKSIKSKNNRIEKNVEIRSEILILENQLSCQTKIFEETLEALKQNEQKINKLDKCFVNLKNKYEQNKLENKSVEELKEDIKNIKLEIENLNKKWEDFLKEYNEHTNGLKEEKKAILNNYNNLNNELNSVKEKIKYNKLILKDKNDSICELTNLLKKNQDLDRSFYTDRIFDIIKNVNKQDIEIKKILDEIINLQREINNVTTKTNRSFRIVEEIFYKSSTTDENYRSIYKMLISLNNDFEKLIDNNENIGKIKRKILTLEEMIENEKSNKTGSNLAKVKYDLEQIRIENQKLENKLKNIE